MGEFAEAWVGMGTQLPWEVPPAPSTVETLIRLCGLTERDDGVSRRLLDLGCGNGRYLEALGHRLGKRNLFGVEVNAEQAVEVQKRGMACIRIGKNQGSLPLAAENFDVVLSSNVVEHMPRPVYLLCLKEVHRILKPGGRFVVGTPNYPTKRLYDLRKAFSTKMFRYYVFDDPTHCNKLSFQRLEKDLRAVFREVRLWPTHIAFQKYIPLIRRRGFRHRLRFLADKIIGYCVK